MYVSFDGEVMRCFCWAHVSTHLFVIGCLTHSKSGRCFTWSPDSLLVSIWRVSPAIWRGDWRRGGRGKEKGRERGGEGRGEEVRGKVRRMEGVLHVGCYMGVYVTPIHVWRCYVNPIHVVCGMSTQRGPSR
jgi:hypothetical protein